MNSGDPGFTPVFEVIIDDIDLTAAVVFGAVWRFCQMQERSCFTTAGKIAERAGVSARTVKDRLYQLEERGWLIAERRPGKPTIYRDAGRVVIRSVATEIPMGGAKSATPEVDDQVSVPEPIEPTVAQAALDLQPACAEPPNADELDALIEESTRADGAHVDDATRATDARLDATRATGARVDDLTRATNARVPVRDLHAKIEPKDRNTLGGLTQSQVLGGADSSRPAPPGRTCLGPGSQIIREETHLTPRVKARPKIEAVYQEMGAERLRWAAEQWCLHGWNPRNVAGILEVARRGTLRRERSPTDDRRRGMEVLPNGDVVVKLGAR